MSRYVVIGMGLLLCLAGWAYLAQAQQAAAPAPTGFAVSDIGSIQGDLTCPFVHHESGDSVEWGEKIVIKYTAAIDTDSFKANLAITPKTPFSIYVAGYGKMPLITVRKTPGEVYTLNITAGVKAKDGSVDNTAHEFKFTTPAEVPIPAPLRQVHDEPYRYGVLDHPWPKFLAFGPTSDKQFQLLKDVGVGFVRIDWMGDSCNPKPGEYNFDTEDKILDRLIADGITELPCILQYHPPGWANDNQKYPAIWSKPEDYAAFAGAVAKHLTEKYPQVTRVELFNEPNLRGKNGGWWKYPDPASPLADNTGKPTAIYMIAAYKAIKAANPKLMVVGPALATGGSHCPSGTFIQNMYDAGCRRGNGWDELDLHNYSWMSPEAPLTKSTESRFDVYKDAQEIAAKNGDADVRVMLTEWGFSNADNPDSFDPRVQALYLAQGLNRMLADPSVDGIVYVNVYNPDTDFWGDTSLVSKDFQPFPGFHTYQTFTKGLAQ